MAFSMGASNPAGSVSAELGPELPDLYAEEVGFKGVSGDTNVQFLPTPWPADALPAPTCTLLAVAATKGVLVGAGPDSLYVASTEAVRAAMSASTSEDKVKTRPFQAQATIPLPARPTHIAFASGDSALVLATENGSPLSVFETNSLLQPNAQPAISISTNGATFRSIAPNPAQEGDSHSSLVALVTTAGELLMADLKAGNLISGQNGTILKTGVSSVGWSNKGKQLIAGLADGTGYQMTPDGTQKDLIPRPPDLSEPCHVSSIAWLENDIILMVYTPDAAEDDMGLTPSSSYYIITKRKQAPFLVQKLPELSSPFGFKRAPAYQFIARLRDYKPHLKDVLIVSSTASADVGLITRSDHPLASDDSARATVGQFVTTEVNDDTKKASVPLKDSVDETSVIGLAVDLSSSEVVTSPIQGDEDIPESPTPLPNLLLLNHEGMLSSWWFIYTESIRQKIPYHGLASAGIQQQPASQLQTRQSQPTTQPAFGKPGFGSPVSAGTSPFATSGFGKLSSAPAFGSPSALGGSSPVGGFQQPSFGKPSFGKPSFGTPAFGTSSFGAPSALGSSSPQFGKSGFGQPSTPGKVLGSLPFGTPGATSGGGFGAFANTGGFAGLAASKPSGESPFSKATGDSPFSKPSGPSLFGNQSNNDSAFTPQKADESKGGFGLGSGGFVLGSTFKGDGTAVNDAPKPEKPSGLFSFGTSLDDMVSTPTKASPPTEAMDDMEDATAPRQSSPQAKEPAPSLFGAPSSTTTGTSLFGSFGAQTQTQQPLASTPTSTSPFAMLKTTAPEKEMPSPLSPPSDKTAVASPPLTQARSPEPETTPVTTVPEAPLPPDSISKTEYGPGDTSASSNVSKASIDDAPLPPDFTAAPKSSGAVPELPLPPDFTSEPKEEELEESVKAEEAPLPPDFAGTPKSPEPESEAPLPPDFTLKPKEEKRSPFPAEDRPPTPDGSEADESGRDSNEEYESEFGDSGEEITNELAQPETSVLSLQSSPESSFDAKKPGKSPAGGLFDRISKPGQTGEQQPRQLFGEITQPFFARREQTGEPPRSPSPVRPPRAQQGLPKLGDIRSTSTPHKPGSALAARKASLSELAKREIQLKPEPTRERRRKPTAQVQEEHLSDDEDERLRADLSRPLEPVPTLDPFLPHQDYMGQTAKPGIPGQIERLYRDINSMVDTLGINARSLSSFLLSQQQSTDSDWVNILKSDHPADVLDEKLILREIEGLGDAVAVLAGSLEEQRVQMVEEKLESCRELLSKDIMMLRSQCASVRKTLDAHTDAAAIVSAPLSAEQASIQQDLRTSSAEIQARLADLESAVSLLRARIADASRGDGSRQSMRRPTVEAVTSTIATMMSMAESRSSDIDVLEVQLRKLGLDTSATETTREGSPFTTPRKGLGRVPTTPGSRGSTDGPISSYHTPDSTSRGVSFRSSVNGSAKASRLRAIDTSGGEGAQWKAKMQRKQHILEGLRKAMGEKQSKVRSVDNL